MERILGFAAHRPLLWLSSTDLNLQFKNQTKTPTPDPKNKKLIHPGHTLSNQKLIQSLISIKPPPTTILHTAMRKSWLIMDRHTINMNRPAIKSAKIHPT